MRNSGRTSAWKILYDPRFAGDLERLGRPAQLRIRKYLDKLQRDCADPRERGEPLKANLSGLWKYRVGDYRLLCQITDGQVVLLGLLMAAHRSQSYSERGIEELLKRANDLLRRLES